jgi:hypothetical protein
MPDKEVNIGNETIGENTKISFTVKTAIWIISGLIILFSSAFTVAYFDVKDDVKDYKNQIEKDKSEFIKTVEEKLDEKLGSFQEKDEQFIKEIGDIKGDIKVILDRTKNIRGNTTIIDGNEPPSLN